MRQAIVALLVLGLSAPLSAGPIADSVAKAAAVAARQSSRASLQQWSRRDWLAMTLVTTGVGFMAAGFTAGRSVSTNAGGPAAGQNSGGARNTTLGLVGVGLAGAGLAVLFAGRHPNSPELTLRGRSASISKTIRF